MDALEKITTIVSECNFGVKLHLYPDFVRLECIFMDNKTEESHYSRLLCHHNLKSPVFKAPRSSINWTDNVTFI